MAIVTTRTEFKNYCLRKLGSPVIQVNVADEQVEDRIDDAFEYYRDYHYDAVEDVFLKHQITADDITNKWIPIPNTIIGVKQVLPLYESGKTAMNMFDVRYQMFLNDIYNLSSTEMLTYELTQSHIQMVNDMLDVMFVASFGNWKFDGDAMGNYQETEYNSEGQAGGYTTTEYAYALDGLYVGDMPQTAYVLGVTLKPVKGLMVQAIHKTYDKNYSDWSPGAREFDGTNDDADRAQVYEAPGYSKLDLHMSYKLPKVKGLDMTLNGHIFNVLDEVFVQDAVDNSRYNSYGTKAHLAHNAEVFLGTPRYANIGLTINF